MQFPKILILHLPKINKTDANASAAVLRSLFFNWPKEKLFQIYNSNDMNDEGYCSSYYKLSNKDRFIGKLFFRAKAFIRKKWKINNTKNTTYLSQDKDSFQYAYREPQWTHSGLQDIIFYPVLNSKLRNFVETVQPDIIYCQGYSLNIIIITLKLSKKFKIPLIIHPLDDWAYNRLILTRLHKLISPVWKYWTKKLFNEASIRLVVNTKMANEYKSRYGYHWDVIPVIIDSGSENHNHFPNQIDNWKEDIPGNKVALCYTGSFGGGRRKTLEWLAKELRILGIKHNKDYRIFIYTNNNLSQEANLLKQYPNISVELAIPSNEVPSLLKSADILVLSESFSINDSITDQFVLSSKVPVYTQSKKPIIALGSMINGTIKDAYENKWALVVSELCEDILDNAIINILYNQDEIIDTAYQYWKKNLEPMTIQKYFIKLINESSLNE